VGLKEQLESAGCRIIEESEGRIVVSCPVDVLNKGLSVKGVKDIGIAERKEKNVTLILKKEK